MSKQAIFVFFLAAINSSLSFSQTGQLSTDHSQKVMIIPFNEFYYLSDADAELAQRNNKSQKEISDLFRVGLDYNINARVIAAHHAHSMLQDSSVQSVKDLQYIYSSISYTYQKPMDIYKDTLNNDIENSDVFGIHQPEQEDSPKKIFSIKKQVEDSVEHDRYLNAVIKNPNLFYYLNEKYAADLFLFINQFELITNYENCLDRATNNFERMVVIHYSIYNLAGQQLKGDAVTVTFASNQTNVEQIINEYFPIVGNYMSNEITYTTTTPATQANKK